MKDQFEVLMKPFLMILIASNELEVKNIFKILKIYCGGSWTADSVHIILNQLAEIARAHHSIALQHFSANYTMCENETHLPQTISTIYRSSCNITRIEELMKKFIYSDNIPNKITIIDCSNMLSEVKSLNKRLSDLYNLCLEANKKE